MLESIITSKTRIRLLVKFFVNEANRGYLRGLASEMNENTNAIRKELNNLSEAGYILRDASSSKIIYRANTTHPFFVNLQQLVRKHIGIDAIVDTILQRMGEVNRVFVLGDFAKGIDSTTIEVVIEGSNLNESYINQLVPKVKAEIGKDLLVCVTHSYTGEGLLVFEK